MKKTLIIIFLILLILANALFLLFWQPISSYLYRFSDTNNFTLQNFEKFFADEIVKKISTPPPLIGDLTEKSSFLTEAGILKYTNSFRQQDGALPLKINESLRAAAKAKLDDMFAQQYFEHISPQGFGPDHWVLNQNYSYISVGENLALGNYEDDQELVEAWMASPGHRENILDKSFSEIGIAVGKGEFEGSNVWLAVQVFGRPQGECPLVDKGLENEIEILQNQLKAWELELDNLTSQLKREKPKGRASQEELDQYNRLVQRYNDLANRYNETANLIKEKVSTYNQQVADYNNCANL